MKLDDDDRLVRYLLGELPQREREELENGYFADDSSFLRILAVEDELIDAYLRGGLSEGRRREFEARFLASAEQRRKVEFAREFLRRAEESCGPLQAGCQVSGAREAKAADHCKSRCRSHCERRFGKEFAGGKGGSVACADPLRQNPTEPRLKSAAADEKERFQRGRWQPSFYLRSLLEAGGSRRGARANTRRHSRARCSRRNRAPCSRRLRLRPSPRGGAAPGEKPKAEPGAGNRPETGLVAFALTPGLVRDLGKANTLRIPPGARLVRLEVEHEGRAYRRYRAVLQTVAGREVWRQAELKPLRPGAPTVVLTMPAGLLGTDDYILSLSGANTGAFEDVAEYPFRARR